MSRWRGRLRSLLRGRARASAPAWAALETTPAASPRPPSGVLADLDAAQLCALWRKSAAGLSGASDLEQHLAVVGARGALLTELERRDPAPMAAWLVTGGAGEPAGPAAYLVGADLLPGRRASHPQESRER